MQIDIKTEEIKEITLADNSRFSYIIKQIEITNALGAAVAVLDEYFITTAAAENYKLYKTKEGNWYDVPDANKEVDKAVLLELKLGVDNNKQA